MEILSVKSALFQQLVSPEDLLKAAELSGPLNLGVSLKVFPSSGVKVLQLDSYSDENIVCQRIMDIIARRIKNSPLSSTSTSSSPLPSSSGNVNGLYCGINATDVSEELHLSLIIAKEQLLIAEKLEFLCRDESLSGIYFYPNLFRNFTE